VRRWADNTPFHLLYIAEIKKTIPNAQFVHIIRDGRDVAMSLSRMGWPHCFPWDAKHRLAIPGLYWKWLVSQGRESGRKLGSDYLELQYEQLLAHPQETLATLSQFIGENLSYRVIQKNAVGTVARPNSSFPYTGELNSVGRWKNLSDAEAVQLTTLLSPLLSELGYQTARVSGAPFSTWRLNMLYWAIVFFVVALIAGILGFAGVAVAAAGIAKILFFVFLVLFLVSLVSHLASGNRSVS